MKNFSSLRLEATLINLILLFAAYLRLWNLEDNPAWYTDEATHLDIARHLLNGENRYLAIDDSYLIFARLPLFEYSLALLFQIFGVSMLVLRGFTAGLGLLTVLLLYAVVRAISKESWLSLAVALAYAIMPQALLYNRFGFSYNLLLPLTLLSLWAAVRYQTSGNRPYLALLSLCFGLGCISEILMWSFLLVIPLLTWQIRWKDMFWGLALALFPLAIYCVWQLLTIPEAFLFDLGYSVGRTSGGTPFEQLKRIAENYTVLLSDFWFLLGVIGLFLLRDKVMRGTCLVFFLPLLFIARTVPLYSLSAYYAVPFLPLVAIGLGAFFTYGITFVLQQLRENIGQILSYGIIVFLFLVPVAYSIIQSSTQVQTRIPTSIDAFLLNPIDVREVLNYIHANSTEDDLLIASAPLAVLLDRPAADFQMAVLAMGFDAVHLPHDLPPERFTFDIDYHAARYVVVDNLWRNWGAVHMPALVTILDDLKNWPIVFEAGALQVYENPKQ
jgi:4-amino-4-deoxy-L-arabinose transferase-like glycosyltransferase